MSNRWWEEDGRWFPRLKTDKEMGRKPRVRQALDKDENRIIESFRALKMKRMNWFRFLNIVKDIYEQP